MTSRNPGAADILSYFCIFGVFDSYYILWPVYFTKHSSDRIFHSSLPRQLSPLQSDTGNPTLWVAAVPSQHIAMIAWTPNRWPCIPNKQTTTLNFKINNNRARKSKKQLRRGQLQAFWACSRGRHKNSCKVNSSCQSKAEMSLSSESAGIYQWTKGSYRIITMP